MPNTFELIASSTVGSGGAANIEFTSIPATFTDLVIKVSGKNNGTSGYFEIRFNGSTSGYTLRNLYGDGSAAASNTDTVITARLTTNTQTASTFASSDIYIPNYAGSTNKSVSIDTVQENNATSAQAFLGAGLWSNTAAITSVNLLAANSFVQYSTAYLYGVKNA
jgi:hypothetical protein